VVEYAHTEKQVVFEVKGVLEWEES
jgi:hypothetical protein